MQLLEWRDRAVAFEPVSYTTPTEDELVWEIDVNWEVQGSDGKKVGVVRDVQPFHLLVKNGRFRAEELIVPVTVITDVRHECVYLSLTKADLEEQQAQSAAAAATGDTDTLVRETHDPERTIQFAVPSDFDPSAAVAETAVVADDLWGQQLGSSKNLGDPELTATTRGADAAGDMAVDDGLRADDMRVARRELASRYAAGAPFVELDILIPNRGEAPVVSKRPVVREVVEIGKLLHEREQRVSATVRRERIAVAPDGGFPFLVDGQPLETMTA